jgi:hypothetical protein
VLCSHSGYAGSIEMNNESTTPVSVDVDECPLETTERPGTDDSEQARPERFWRAG